MRTSKGQHVRPLVVLSLGLILSACFDAAPSKDLRSNRQLPIPQGLQDGDIIFRTGRDAIASMVLARTADARFSHVGMILSAGDEVFVIHAAPADQASRAGVRIEPLHEFIASTHARQAAYFRLNDLTAAQRKILRDYLISQLGKPFDSDLRYSDDSEMYCTELVLKSLRQAGADLESGLARVTVMTMPEAVIPPDSLSRSARLEEIT